MQTCPNHSGLRTLQACGTCGVEFCGDCLVFTHGQRRAPRCVDCALTVAGVDRSRLRGRPPAVVPPGDAEEIRR